MLTKLKDKNRRLRYAEYCQQNGWSRNVLIHQIESQLLERKGNAITNFENTLATPQSELAQEVLKGPYIFDFLSIGEKAKERDIEQALTQHISQFLLELGAGFAFVGRRSWLGILMMSNVVPMRYRDSHIP